MPGLLDDITQGLKSAGNSLMDYAQSPQGQMMGGGLIAAGAASMDPGHARKTLGQAAQQAAMLSQQQNESEDRRKQQSLLQGDRHRQQLMIQENRLNWAKQQHSELLSEREEARKVNNVIKMTELDQKIKMNEARVSQWGKELGLAYSRLGQQNDHFNASQASIMKRHGDNVGLRQDQLTQQSDQFNKSHELDLSQFKSAQDAAAAAAAWAKKKWTDELAIKQGKLDVDRRKVAVDEREQTSLDGILSPLGTQPGGAPIKQTMTYFDALAARRQ
jgi:hypothetical protein